MRACRLGAGARRAALPGSRVRRVEGGSLLPGGTLQLIPLWSCARVCGRVGARTPARPPHRAPAGHDCCQPTTPPSALTLGAGGHRASVQPPPRSALAHHPLHLLCWCRLQAEQKVNEAKLLPPCQAPRAVDHPAAGKWSTARARPPHHVPPPLHPPHPTHPPVQAALCGSVLAGGAAVLRVVAGCVP